ncbi:MAG TPA: tetratricopeptide repeat protein [Bryobacteraceae bacterium]|nr:tetratricopeptide repeat protein [Bryobacteraceae bacterium]
MAGRSIDLAAGHDRPSQPSASQIRAQLARILESRIFVQSERLRRFLRLTVERTLAGKTDQIKEYALGRDVFDRGRDFDPRIDSIVRVEAGRLRRKLGQYYQELGSADPVRIEFQQGSYVPSFRYSAPTVPPLSVAPSTQQERPSMHPRTVAVLPFLNVGSDPSQEFFSDGMTEEILDTLALCPQLKLVARTSVFHFKGVSADVREIGERLGAGTVIEGSVRKAGDRMRISVKAIDAAKGTLLWSGRFDREAAHVFAVQEEIARHVADSLHVSLAPAQRVSGRAKWNVEAHNAYLRGRHHWHHVTQGGVRKAVEEFERAIAFFPGHAPSYVGLANVYGYLAFWSVIPPGEGIPRAQQAALEALRLDGSLAGAYAMLGVLASLVEYRWEEGARLMKRAIELQPSNMTTRAYYATHLMCRGQLQELQAEIDKIFELDPLSQFSFQRQGFSHYFQRQYDKALDAFKTALDLDPSFREAQYMLAYAYLRQSRFEEASAQLLELPAGPFGANRLAALGEVYGRAGNAAAARDALGELDSLAKTSYVSPMSRLAVYAGLGEWERVFEELEQAYTDQCPMLCLLKVDPRYEPIRSDPRFVNLLERMNLA